MSDFSLFDVAASEPEKRTANETPKKNAAAVEREAIAKAASEIKREYGQFLANAKTAKEFNERWASLGNQTTKKIAEHIFPKPAVLRKVKASVKPPFGAKAASKKTANEYIDGLMLAYREAVDEGDWEYAEELKEEIERERHTSSKRTSKWQKNANTGVYVLANNETFSCPNCGTRHASLGMFRCACGQTWNSWKIEKGGSTTLLCREVPERRDAILASRKQTPAEKVAMKRAAARRKTADALDSACDDLITMNEDWPTPKQIDDYADEYGFDPEDIQDRIDQMKNEQTPGYKSSRKAAADDDENDDKDEDKPEVTVDDEDKDKETEEMKTSRRKRASIDWQPSGDGAKATLPDGIQIEINKFNDARGDYYWNYTDTDGNSQNDPKDKDYSSLDEAKSAAESFFASKTSRRSACRKTADRIESNGGWVDIHENDFGNFEWTDSRNATSALNKPFGFPTYEEALADAQRFSLVLDDEFMSTYSKRKAAKDDDDKSHKDKASDIKDDVVDLASDKATDALTDPTKQVGDETAPLQEVIDLLDAIIENEDGDIESVTDDLEIPDDALDEGEKRLEAAIARIASYRVSKTIRGLDNEGAFVLGMNNPGMTSPFNDKSRTAAFREGQGSLDAVAAKTDQRVFEAGWNAYLAAKPVPTNAPRAYLEGYVAASEAAPLPETEEAPENNKKAWDTLQDTRKDYEKHFDGLNKENKDPDVMWNLEGISPKK